MGCVGKYLGCRPVSWLAAQAGIDEVRHFCWAVLWALQVPAQLCISAQLPLGSILCEVAGVLHNQDPQQQQEATVLCARSAACQEPYRQGTAGSARAGIMIDHKWLSPVLAAIRPLLGCNLPQHLHSSLPMTQHQHEPLSTSQPPPAKRHPAAAEAWRVCPPSLREVGSVDSRSCTWGLHAGK